MEEMSKIHLWNSYTAREQSQVISYWRMNASLEAPAARSPAHPQAL